LGIELNRLRVQTLKAAKREFQQREMVQQQL